MSDDFEAESHYSGMEIAIVGMAGRFPGAKNIDEFWHNLCAGVESITSFSDQELVDAGVDPVILGNTDYVKAGAILDDIDLFDAGFFSIVPREAELIDPQQRLFLECVWEALENAGYDSERFDGRIGLFAGSRSSTYLLSNLYTHQDLCTNHYFQMMLANDKDYLTTRVSYKLNLNGPSVNISTACSTSMIATHLACQSLLSGTCDMALAGGVAITVPQKVGYLYQEGGIQSPDGHCRPFDRSAHGTVGGNGVGVVVLRRLEEALADHDHIYAVIKGSAINNDGALKVGYTAPGVEGQAQVVRAAQISAEVEPETISYIEAHGTGTALGDPIEVAALTSVFREQTEQRAFCALGSVKSNIGHLDAAAGVVSIIKTSLALKHRLLPPSLHFRTPNPQIDFAHSPFYINTRLAEWRHGAAPRRAGVSSFGIGGSNGHLILEEAPARSPAPGAGGWQVLALSARSPAALEGMTANLAAYLNQHPDLALADVAHTLQVGRRAFDYRRAVICRDRAGAVQAMKTHDDQWMLTGAQPAEKRPIVFMFPGQGAQYVDMGRGLYESQPFFREQVDRCAEILRPHLGLDIRSVLYPDNDRGVQLNAPTTTDDPFDFAQGRRRPTTGSDSPAHPLNGGGGQRSLVGGRDLNQTWLAQPALFTIGYALSQLWMHWGIQPQAMIGHSIGEYVAACLADVFSLEETLALVAARGRLMQQLPAGAMMAVPLPEAELRPLLGTQLAVAAVNTPTHCVVAGTTEAVEGLRRQLADQGLVCRPLHTSHAFHSAMMDPILASFTEMVRQISLKLPRIPFVSNVTGDWIGASEATDPNYWARHLRQTVRLADGFRTLAQEPRRVVLEVGPGQTLSTLAAQQPDWSPATLALASLRRPRDQQPDETLLLKTLSQLWLAGCAIDWPTVAGTPARQRIPLPTYPFERQRYWIAPARPAAHAGTPAGDPAKPAAPGQIEAPPDDQQSRAFSAIPTSMIDDARIGSLEAVISQQLQVMLQQLDVLDTDGAADVCLETSEGNTAC